VLGEADADGLGEAADTADAAADGDADVDVEAGPALAAARTNPAGSAWTADVPPGTPAACGLEDGAADGDVDGDGVGVADVDAEVDADGDTDGDTDGAGELVTVWEVVSWTSVPVRPVSLVSYTCRMLSSAVSPMFLSTPEVSLPGTEMTTFLPSSLTSALLTPRLLTRFARMFFAVLRSPLVTLTPVVDLGSRVTVVPPRRSRPSAGEYRPPSAISP